MKPWQYGGTDLEKFLDGFRPLRADKDLFEQILGVKMSDNINSPAHYQSESGLEVIDVIESFELNYNLGNVIKYVLRAGKKGSELEDLKKACYYLRREIKQIELEEDEDE